jgi:4-amino-4-deoxy-L-arabinose transferase-like glycosyltransferase
VTRALRYWVPIILLGTFFGLSYASALRESITFDESIHLVSGYAFWKTGFYTMDLLHPPLLRLWATFPLYVMHAPWPYQAAIRFSKDPWMLAHIWLFLGPKPVDFYLLPSRMMVILLGVGLGALIWVWSNQAYGKVAAIASLVAYSFCPVLLAYSHYVTTDFGPAIGSTLVLYIFWLHSKRPTLWWRSLLEGAALGLTISLKFSELIMLPLVGTILLVSQREKLKASGFGFQLLGFGSILCLTYGFTDIGSFFKGLNWL